ncbi:YkuS family protein [Lutispora thermophila]|uniref:Uncharacterized protein family (UPF0180) n=1 Tax=Lutispora thermophila DSM 19022 TaxID=1122184 RepID=A0A1M6HYI2_9FIRM|nr:YkuS family protein [Lutispora thermophila]SHJ27245.1 Uncharacterised protein family (UPF0180) [Lutispora thermophila DSM 19022]
MIIAIEKGLENIKQQLESRGYKCFYIGEEGVADAIIYKDKDNHPYFEVNKSSILNLSNSTGTKCIGALLINSQGKNIEEIMDILNRRTYSPLF